MKDVITVDLGEVKRIIDDLRRSRDRIFTSDVIRAYCGGFFANRGISAAQSFNAQFGALLQKHAEYLGITMTRENVSVRDDRGLDDKAIMTHAAEWALT